MAEGGGDFGYDDPDLDFNIDNDDMYDDDDEQEVDTTRPFQPGAASTPYQGGEYEMQTMQHEQSGLPSYYERVPLLTDERNSELEKRLAALREDRITGLLDTREVDTSLDLLSEEDKKKQIERMKALIRKKYPRVDFAKLGPIGFSNKKPLIIVLFGPRGVEAKIVLDDGSGLQNDFLNRTFVKRALGPPAEEIINQTSSEIRKRQKELEKERNDFQISQQNLRSRNEEIHNLDERLNKEQAKIDQLKENQGPDYEEEIKRKEQLLKNLKKDLKTKQKEREELQKKIKK